MHTGGRSGQVPGAGRAVLHTGGRGELVPGAGRLVLHTAGRDGQVPGAGRPDLHTGGRSGQVPGAGRGFLHTGSLSARRLQARSWSVSEFFGEKRAAKMPAERSEAAVSPGGPLRSSEGDIGIPLPPLQSRRMPALKRRKRDSNPRNVAVQQFSRLPPSTTRPFLQSGLQI